MLHPSYADVLNEPLIRWRRFADGELQRSSLPALFAALVADEVRDFPALRPHQRHPWFAFLVQLAVIALHRAGQNTPWTDAAAWRAALLALTPDDPDGAAWCLVSPPERPALLQAPVPGENPADWKNLLHAPDELDMLVTSKNHDLKGARARQAEADDWLFALVSLQTQEGFLGAGNYGVSRMNGGFASRPGVGITPVGLFGKRWLADTVHLLGSRHEIAQHHGYAAHGHALLWLLPWSGQDALAMASLDPLYIELCRRVRLSAEPGPPGQLRARVTGSKVARINAKDGNLNGVTGDPWTPVDTAQAKALTVSAAGFDYKLMSRLLTSDGFTHGAAWRLSGWPRDVAIQVIAQATVRGQGKTEGYHERRLPVPPTLRSLLGGDQRKVVADAAAHRIQDIAAVRKLLWSALLTLFANGESDVRNDAISERASRFARPFEQAEDPRFFDDLNAELEALAEGQTQGPQAQQQRQALAHLHWQQGLVQRAEAVLRDAFAAGPRSGMQRYKAQAGALTRFHGGLRGRKPALRELADHLAQVSEAAKASTNTQTAAQTESQARSKKANTGGAQHA